MIHNGKIYPYGFGTWMNQLWQIGNKLVYWSFTVVNYKDKLDFDAWMFYFMLGLHPKDAITMDLNEQS